MNSNEVSESQARAVSQPESTSKFRNEVEDFERGLVHGGLENPVNGAVQLTNHLLRSLCPDIQKGIPELHLVDAKKADGSTAGKIGEAVGTTLDFIGLALATGGAGAVGVPAAIVKMGILGAAYGGIFTPTNDTSDHFAKDRLKNAAIDAGTFMAAGGAASWLSEPGLLMARAGQSLATDVARGSLLGAVSGAAGGAAHAEVTAWTKGMALANSADLLQDTESFALIGGLLGGTGAVLNHTTSEAKVVTGQGKISVQQDQDGGDEVMSFEHANGTKITAKNLDGDLTVRTWEITMPDGTKVSDVSKFDYTGNMGGLRPTTLGIRTVTTPDGVVTQSKLSEGLAEQEFQSHTSQDVYKADQTYPNVIANVLRSIEHPHIPYYINSHNADLVSLFHHENIVDPRAF